MRTRSRSAAPFPLLCLLALAMPASAAPAPEAAAGGIHRFVGETTLFAGQADLTKVDPAAIETFLLDLAKSAGIAGGEPLQTPEAEVKKTLAVATKWMNDAKQAGATELYLVADSATFQRNGPTLIVPVADDKAAGVAALINPKQPPGAGAPHPNMPRAQTVPGVGVVFGTPTAANAVKNTKPAPRADLTAALTAAGAAPIKLALAMDPKMRQEMAQNVPPQILGKPGTLITKDLQWVSVSATAPPAASVKALVQSTTPESAKATAELITAALGEATRAPNGPRIPAEASKLLTPVAAGNQVVLSLDAKQMTALATALSEPLMRARRAALRVRSASNMRQILQACLLHANQNKGEYPADLKAVEASFRDMMGGNAKQLMTNPARPDMQPGYVYIKPAKGVKAPGETVVIYEAHKDFGEGVNVGYADGHVVFLSDKKAFDAELAKTAQQ